jgi:transposase
MGKPKPGRKPKVRLKIQERIKRSILRQGYVTKASVVRDMIAKESGVRYSVRQVQRILSFSIETEELSKTRNAILIFY